MSDPASDLRALVADLRAAVHAEIAAGRTHDAVAPEAPAVSAPLAAVAPEAPAVSAPLAAEERSALPISEAPEGPPVAGPPESLADIRADLGDCGRCGRCEGRANLVFGVGDPRARLLVIGEGPSFLDDQRGEPFVDPGGEMLDRMLLNVLGLPREAAYITHVVKCRPSDGRNPQPAEVATCLPFLRRQIRAVSPAVLLVLGSVAHQGLFGTAEVIARARGQWRTFEGIPVMSTFDPAHLLRTPDHKRLAFQDLKALRARYEALVGPVVASDSRRS